VQRLELGGTVGNTIRRVQFLEELVREGDPFRRFGCGQGLADGVGDVAGENVRTVFVVYVRENGLQLCRSV
jgi:hypothetical protein